MKLSRLAAVFAFLALLMAFGQGLGCKPRHDSSALESADDAAAGYFLETTILNEITKVGTLASEGAKSWVGYLEKTPLLSESERIEGYNDVTLLIQEATKEGVLLTEASKKPGAKQNGEGKVFASESSFQGVLGTYDEVIAALKPVSAKDFWRTAWTAEKARRVGAAMNVTSAGFARAVQEIKSWKAVEIQTTPLKPEPVKPTEPIPVATNPPTAQPAIPPTIDTDTDVDTVVDTDPDTDTDTGTATIATVPATNTDPETGTAAIPPKPETDLDKLRKGFHRVKQLEDDLAAGKFEGTVPTLDDLKQALAKDRQAAPANRMGQGLIAELSKINAIAELYAEDAGVTEGYTIQEHTEMVLAVFFEQSRFMTLPQGRDYPFLLPLIVALHDIGKPVAARTAKLAAYLSETRAWGQDKKLTASIQANSSQHIHNAVVASAVLRKLGYGEAETKLAYALLNHDVLGITAKGNMPINSAFSLLQRLAQQAGMPLTDFYSLQRPLYVADATSYDFVMTNHFVTEASGRRTTKNETLRKIEAMIRPASDAPVALTQVQRQAESKRAIPEKQMSSGWGWLKPW